MLKCALVLATVLSASFAGAESRVPVLVELFTSEGCSSCPPADALLADLARTQPVSAADIILLGEHVDYWNYIGWTDRFSSPQWTRRQQDYIKRMRLESAYTPQLVVGGKTQLVAADRRSVVSAIESFARRSEPVDVSLHTVGTKLGVEVRSKRPIEADIVLVITEDGLTTSVPRGENSGRTLSHPRVARVLLPVGSMRGASFLAETEIKLGRDWNRDNLRAVVFVQQPNQGEILGAASTPLR